MKPFPASLLAAAALCALPTAFAADAVLTGNIRTTAGQRLEGVTVSAKREGSPVTTSVYTDKSGRYVFPALPEGSYKVWAQALGFEAAKGSVQIASARTQDFRMLPITDAERRFRQLPGEWMVAALPEATPQDAHMKKIFMNNCTGCHSTSYALQFRFDEDGWKKIIDLMKVVPVTGVYPGPGAKPNQVLDRYGQELAAYLAKARGPGESTMKIATPPRPTGEATRAVWTLYDLPMNTAAGIGTKMTPNDGTDWARGTTSKLGQMPHDGGMGLDGTIYFTANNANREVTIGKVHPVTGEVKFIRTQANNGNAATAHGLARDAAGDFWFDITGVGRRALAKLDVKTDRITVYQTPADMAPLGGAVTIDVDGKGMVWASTPTGAVRFDPATEKFTEYKSLVPAQNHRGNGGTYGAAGDREGNGWWAQMALDTIYKAEPGSGKVTAIRIPDVQVATLSEDERKFHASVSDVTFSTAPLGSPGPRRMGTDKNGDVLWVGNSWGASFAKIDTKTNEVQVVPLPDPTMQAYHIAVDSQHRVWGNLWTSDRVVRYDPDKKSWAVFDLPVRGTEIRHIALHEKDGKVFVIMPVYRTNQMGVLTVRSEAEMAAALKR